MSWMFQKFLYNLRDYTEQAIRGGGLVQTGPRLPALGVGIGDHLVARRTG